MKAYVITPSAELMAYELPDWQPKRIAVLARLAYPSPDVVDLWRRAGTYASQHRARQAVRNGAPAGYAKKLLEEHPEASGVHLARCAIWTPEDLAHGIEAWESSGEFRAAMAQRVLIDWIGRDGSQPEPAVIRTALGAGGRRFEVVNGQRRWIDGPPPEVA